MIVFKERGLYGCLIGRCWECSLIIAYNSLGKIIDAYMCDISCPESVFKSVIKPHAAYGSVGIDHTDHGNIIIIYKSIYLFRGKITECCNYISASVLFNRSEITEERKDSEQYRTDKRSRNRDTEYGDDGPLLVSEKMSYGKFIYDIHSAITPAFLESLVIRPSSIVMTLSAESAILSSCVMMMTV